MVVWCRMLCLHQAPCGPFTFRNGKSGIISLLSEPQNVYDGFDAQKTMLALYNLLTWIYMAYNFSHQMHGSGWEISGTLCLSEIDINDYAACMNIYIHWHMHPCLVLHSGSWGSLFNWILPWPCGMSRSKNWTSRDGDWTIQERGCRLEARSKWLSPKAHIFVGTFWWLA